MKLCVERKGWESATQLNFTYLLLWVDSARIFSAKMAKLYIKMRQTFSLKKLFCLERCLKTSVSGKVAPFLWQIAWGDVKILPAHP